jgi:hypothetical protein
VDPVPDPLLFRKSGSTWNRTQTSGSVGITLTTRPQRRSYSSTEILYDLQVPAEPSSSSAVISDDGIFKVTVGAVASALPSEESAGSSSRAQQAAFTPSPRMNCGLVVKHGHLYLYGGLVEEGDKQLTLTDFYSLGTNHSTVQSPFNVPHFLRFLAVFRISLSLVFKLTAPQKTLNGVFTVFHYLNSLLPFSLS